MPEIVIGVDVDDLVQGAELGLPEGAELRVLQTRRQALLVTLGEFGHGAGAQRIGADFVDHGASSPVMGVGRVGSSRAVRPPYSPQHSNARRQWRSAFGARIPVAGFMSASTSQAGTHKIESRIADRAAIPARWRQRATFRVRATRSADLSNKRCARWVFP